MPKKIITKKQAKDIIKKEVDSRDWSAEILNELLVNFGRSEFTKD